MNKDYAQENLKTYQGMIVLEPVIRFLEISSQEKIRKNDLEEKALASVKSDLAKFISNTNSKYVESVNSDSLLSDSIENFLSQGIASDDLSRMEVPAFVKKKYQGKVIFNYIGGYYKTPGVIWKEAAKSVGIGLLTLGLFIPIYPATSTTMYSMLVDTEKNQVIYFNRDDTYNDPRNPDDFEKMCRKSITDNFESNQRNK